MRKSRIVDGKRIVEQVEMTAEEETDFLAQQSIDNAELAAKEKQHKIKKLIRNELDEAARAAIAGKITAIEKMDDAALDAALAAIGK
jgi:hypothetical protein